MTKPSIAVVGAGVSGLSAAYELKKRGVAVAVFDAASRVGGVLGTSDIAGFRLEWAANGFIPERYGASKLAEELGVETIAADSRAQHRWVFVDNKLRALPASPRALLQSKLVSTRSKMRALAEPFLLSVLDREESVDEYFSRRLGPEIARTIIAPFVTGIFAGDSKRLSLQASFPNIFDLERKGGIVRGGLAKLIGSVVEGDRGTRRPLAPIGGMQALIDGLAVQLHDVTHVQSEVTEVQPHDSGVFLTCTSRAPERFDAVVLALPAAQAANLLRPVEADAATFIDEIEHAPVAVVYIGVKREAISHSLDGFGFLVAADEPPSLLGCVFESVLWPGRAPKGKVLLRCILGGTRDPDMVERSDSSLIATCHSDLRFLLGMRGQAEFAEVRRHVPGIPQYTSGHLERVARAEELALRNRIVLTGSAFHGVSVNRCIADRKSVLDKLSSIGVVTTLLLGLVACASRRPAQSSMDDGGGRSSAVASISKPASGSAAIAAKPGHSSLTVTAQWMWPAAALRRLESLDCGGTAPAAVDVHVMGGVRDAVVTLEGVATPRQNEAAVVSVGGCVISPRVISAGVGSDVEVVARELGAKVRVASPSETRSVLPFRVVGHRYRVPLQEIGVYRISSADFPRLVSYVYVSEYASKVTGATGTARFDDVASGPHTVSVWHPPIDGVAVVKREHIEVKPNTPMELTMALSKR